MLDAADADTLVHSVLGTLDGDATLDGSVDFNDLVKLAQHYNIDDGNRSWAEGDFNHDGNVDFNDLVRLAQHYNMSAVDGSGFSQEFQAAMTAAEVPEPSAGVALLLGISICFGMRRARRSVRL